MKAMRRAGVPLANMNQRCTSVLARHRRNKGRSETSSKGEVPPEFLAVGSAEYEHYFLQNWGAAVFVDAGDAFRSQFETNVGAGVSLRWKSPVGLVRLDIARRWSRKSPIRGGYIW